MHSKRKISFYFYMWKYQCETMILFQIEHMGVFNTGVMGALTPAISKNRLLAPAIFGHFSTVGKIAGAK